jgi:hypothetical protein
MIPALMRWLFALLVIVRNSLNLNLLLLLGIACWPLVPNIAGSNPAEAVGFFGQKNPQHAFLRRGSKAVCPMSQICGMKKNHAI